MQRVIGLVRWYYQRRAQLLFWRQGCRHEALPIGTGGGRPTHPFLKWVNIGLGNLKSAIVGTCRSFDEQHADRYLAAYEWRFNRRFDLAQNLERLARVALPKPYRSIMALGPAGKSSER
jgi:hypothetical protein